MPQKSIHTPIIALLLFLLLVANACHKSDNAQLAAGDCFVTSVNNNEMIVRLDDLQPDKISGSYFYTKALFADPHPFTVSEMSQSSIPNLVSGLSEPNLSMASL